MGRDQLWSQRWHKKIEILRNLSEDCDYVFFYVKQDFCRRSNIWEEKWNLTTPASKRESYKEIVGLRNVLETDFCLELLDESSQKVNRSYVKSKETKCPSFSFVGFYMWFLCDTVGSRWFSPRRWPFSISLLSMCFFPSPTPLPDPFSLSYLAVALNSVDEKESCVCQLKGLCAARLQ